MATTYDNASLVMIPSGVKESKLYSIKPTDGSGDFTFSRGTDTATRVNASGLIEKERGNLLLQSNTFDTTWTLNNASVTGGQSGYDGSNDAWELTAISTSSARVQQFESNTGVQSLSIYAKAGTANFILAEKAGTNGFFAWFDLSNGTIGNTSGDIDTTIEDVGGGWYRCSVSGNPSASSKSQFYVVDANGSTAVTNGATIYIQDAQIEQGLVATDYIETTTAAVYEGITDNLPRLDYSGGASCPSLLLEPSRTNFELHSEYLDAAAVKDNITITSNATTSPEGVDNASSLVDNATSGTHRFYSVPSTTAASGVTMTHSIFAKANGHSWFQLSSGGQTNDQWANFDLTNGVVGNSSASANADIQPMGNGWYRCVINSTTSASSALVATIPTLTNDTDAATRSPSYSGSGNGVFVYGLQVEAGSYPTSYIPTYGTSASRAADSCSKTGISSLIGQTEGTLYVEFEHRIVNTTEDTRFILSDNTYNNWIFFGIENGTSLRYYITSGGVNQLDATATNIFPSAGRYKVALAYEDNLLTIYVNGVQKINNTSSTNIPAMNAFLLSGKEAVTSAVEQVDKQIHQALLFKTRLTNAELAALTA